MKSNADLSSCNTFGLRSICTELFDLNDATRLPEAIEQAQYQIKVLGAGSNVILPERVDASVFRVTANKLEIKETSTHYFVSAEAGCNWDDTLRRLIDTGIGGAENLAAIPGSVGAAPIQNIGAYGMEIESIIDSVEGLRLDDLRFCRLSRSECQFGYRDSVFKRALKENFIVTKVNFRFNKRWQPLLSYVALADATAKHTKLSPKTIYNLVTKIRWSKLPKPEELGNTGSFFKNPVITTEHYAELAAHFNSVPSYPVEKGIVKVPAAWLIEQAGLKGFKAESVGTYVKQPLVLVNLGKATYQNVLSMVTHVQNCVLKQFKIKLEPEVQIW